MNFRKTIHKKKILIIFFVSIIVIIFSPIILLGILFLMLIVGNATSEEQIGKSNYYVVDFHEAWFGYNLDYDTGADIKTTVFDMVEDIYWNECIILVKCKPDIDWYNYYTISLDSCEMNSTLISPASFYNTLDWLKSNGCKMEHRHFEF